MKTLLASAVAGGLLVLTCHCGSSGGTTPGNDAGTNDAGTDGGIVLTVTNFDVWCTLTVNGARQTAGLANYSVDAGEVVALTAMANAGFTFDYWLGTSGANAGNSGKDPNASTSVTVTASKTVLACCDNPPGAVCPTHL